MQIAKLVLCAALRNYDTCPKPKFEYVFFFFFFALNSVLCSYDLVMRFLD